MPAPNAHHHSRCSRAYRAASSHGHHDQRSLRARVQNGARPFGDRFSGSMPNRRIRRWTPGRRQPRGWLRGRGTRMVDGGTSSRLCIGRTTFLGLCFIYGRGSAGTTDIARGRIDWPLRGSFLLPANADPAPVETGSGFVANYAPMRPSTRLMAALGTVVWGRTVSGEGV